MRGRKGEMGNGIAEIMSWDREPRWGWGAGKGIQQMLLQFHTGQRLSWDLASTNPDEKQGMMSSSSISQLLLPLKAGRSPPDPRSWPGSLPSSVCWVRHCHPGHQRHLCLCCTSYITSGFYLHLYKSLHKHKTSVHHWQQPCPCV